MIYIYARAYTPLLLYLVNDKQMSNIALHLLSQAGNSKTFATPFMLCIPMLLKKLSPPKEKKKEFDLPTQNVM